MGHCDSMGLYESRENGISNSHLALRASRDIVPPVDVSEK